MPTSITPPPAENEIECARCGAYVHISLSRCPHCGVNLYEPEEDDETDVFVSKTEHGFLGSVKAFFRRIFGQDPHSSEIFLVEAQKQQTHYSELLRKVGWDPAVVERLLEFEKRISPNATRTTCLENAIRRWEKDNQ